MEIREPAVAGQFYPGNAESLQAMIKKFIDNVRETRNKEKIYGIIVPHAGYEYSGQTAAYAYKLIQDKKYDTVVILGPSHQMPFKGAAIYPSGYFKTPLGNIEIDASVAEKIISQSRYINDMTEPHIPEHSLEVQLPFLQTVLSDFKIVPICMMDQSLEMCQILAHAIIEAIHESSLQSVLIVASSDFYHGYDYEGCKQSLKEATSLIAKYDTEGFHKVFLEQSAACGGGCITTCMLVAQELGAKRVNLLQTTNSADVTGMKGGYVVGYASFVLVNPKEKAGLSKDERELLVEIARNSIASAVTGKPQEKSAPPESSILREKRGCFVTVKKQGELRGCIGYILPVKPLYQAIAEMAVQAALQDPRFQPVTKEELPELKLEISVLTPLQRMESIEEIQIGRDGLYLKKEANSGLLLPQVAAEYGWNRQQFLEQTCWKGGLQTDAWKDAEIYRFQAEVFGDEE